MSGGLAGTHKSFGRVTRSNLAGSAELQSLMVGSFREVIFRLSLDREGECRSVENRHAVEAFHLIKRCSFGQKVVDKDLIVLQEN